MERFEASLESPQVPITMASDNHSSQLLCPLDFPSKTVLGKRNFEDSTSCFQKPIVKRVKILGERMFQDKLDSRSQERVIEDQHRPSHHVFKNSLLQSHLMNILLCQQIQQIKPIQIDHYFEGLSNIKNQLKAIFNSDQGFSSHATNHENQTMGPNTQMEPVKKDENPLEKIENKRKTKSSESYGRKKPLSDRNKKMQKNFTEGEPALVEFTREFPGWDLRTIFEFVSGGKTKKDCQKRKRLRPLDQNKKV